MPIVKSFAKKQISRQLFKVCRLNKLETRSQVESYFLEYQDFRGLQYCSPAEVEELERFINADLLRLERKWELPRELLLSGSIVQLADLLLEKQLFPGHQMQVFKDSLRIYGGRPRRSLWEMAAELDTTENSLYRGRNNSVRALIKILKSLRALRQDLPGDYGLDTASGLLIIDEARAQRINAKAGTAFSPQFLSLLFGIHLEADFVLLGKPAEALAGNYVGNRHYWSNFYLLKRELATSLDMDGLLQEAFRLLYLHEGETQRLNFRNFVSYFTKKTAALDELLPVVAEILHRELGLKVGKQGQLNFPRRELLIRSYCYEALEAIGEPGIQREIRGKMSEMHPEAFMVPMYYSSVMLDKHGFTNYKQLYFGLRKWYPDTHGSLRHQDPALLEGLMTKYSRSTYRAEMWQALMDFIHTHSRLPKLNGKQEEVTLRTFWKTQISRARQGNYYPEHRQQLEELESRFRSKKKYKPRLNWDERYARIKAFTKANGIPPQRAATGEEKIFHNWLREQRKLMKKGKLEQRQEVLIKHFDELFPYKNKKYFEMMWDKSFAELEGFVQTHFRAPKREGKEGVIERWYTTQRVRMGKGELNRRQSKLIQGIIDKYPLKDLEFRKIGWHERCSELEQFAEAHSHLPRYTVEEENALNVWFTRQKQYGVQGKLDARQLARLQRLTDNLEVPSCQEQHFNEKLAGLKEFIRLHSRFPRQAVSEEVALYTWSWMQLKRAKTGKLKPMQAEQLLKLWDTYGNKRPAWIERFRQLRTFAETHSRLPKVSAATREEKALYTWFRGQTTRLNKGLLEQREANLLGYLFTRYGRKRNMES